MLSPSNYFLSQAIAREKHARTAAKSHLKAAKMTNAEGQVSDDWLADIFDADDDDAITSLKIGEMPLPQGTLAALEAAGRASAGPKRSREEDGHQSTNQKK